MHRAVTPAIVGINKDRETNGKLRAGDIAGWGWERLFAVAHSIEHDVVVTLVPRARPAV